MDEPYEHWDIHLPTDANYCMASASRTSIVEAARIRERSSAQSKTTSEKLSSSNLRRPVGASSCNAASHCFTLLGGTVPGEETPCRNSQTDRFAPCRHIFGYGQAKSHLGSFHVATAGAEKKPYIWMNGTRDWCDFIIGEELSNFNGAPAHAASLCLF